MPLEKLDMSSHLGSIDNSTFVCLDWLTLKIWATVRIDRRIWNEYNDLSGKEYYRPSVGLVPERVERLI